MAEEKLVKEPRQYIGRRMDRGNKMRWAWYYPSLDDGGNDNGVRYHGKAPGSPSAIGSTWEFSLTSDGSYYTSGDHGPVLLDTADPKSEEVIRWATLDRVAVTQNAAKRKAAKAVRDGDFEAILKPIRDVYHVSNSGERAAIIAAVVTEITTI